VVAVSIAPDLLDDLQAQHNLLRAGLVDCEKSNPTQAAYGRSSVPRCYLATGGTAGLMNLLYNADITQRPDLTPEFYEKTFKSLGFFVAREEECRTMGAPSCRIVAERP
jgi:hypothetical protein